eukprot:m.108190 g.108190  ORF g.108190 m.108190 type:complete len:239 (-) comp13953_c0_seq7:1038-1754(-)
MITCHIGKRMISAALVACNRPVACKGYILRPRCTFQVQRRSLPIYTRTGDQGETSLYNGERRRKNDIVFEALGNIDELNSAIGLARSLALDSCASDKTKELQEALADIQSRLLDLGSHVATPRSESAGARTARMQERTTFGKEYTNMLEGMIDNMDSELPPLKNFILPSGGPAASALHISRSVCRRAERSIVPLLDLEEIDESAYKFVNRLSDYLFTAARYTAMKELRPEVVYKAQKR